MHRGVVMSLPNLDDLRVSKQVIPTSTLLKLMDKHGFVSRNTQGSHIIAAHSEFPDITMCVIRNTKKISCQRDLIDAVDEIARRKEIALTQEFANAAKKITDILDVKVPNDLTYRLTENGNVVLSDRAFPQIGTTFSQKDVDLTENKVRYITDIKRQYAALLGRLVSDYDVNTPNYVQGVFDGELSHMVYTTMDSAKLEPYQEGDSTDAAFNNLYDYITRIELTDLDHQIRKEEALSKPFINQTLITSMGRRGERHNHVMYEGPGNKPMHFEFNTYSNRRVTYNGLSARISDAELGRLELFVMSVERKQAQSANALQRHAA
jgi:predicted RNA binding protein YcfA (HicA-like mRNA interferase family)